MCFLLNVAPPPACLLSRTPPSSHTFPPYCSSTSEAPLPPPPVLFPLRALGILTFSPPSLLLHLLLPLLDVACGLLVPPPPPPRTPAPLQLHRRKRQSTEKHTIAAQIKKKSDYALRNTSQKARKCFVAFYHQSFVTFRFTCLDMEVEFI